MNIPQDAATERMIRSEIRIAVTAALSPWRTKAQAAAYLGVSQSWLMQLVREGNLRAYYAGTQVRFKVEDLDKLFQ